MTRVALNGLGRIGRAALKMIIETPELELVAVNDIAPRENLAYLLKYDTAYGKYHKDVKIDGEDLVIDGMHIKLFQERNPADLPWAEMEVPLVFECTGFFCNKEGMQKHLAAGAKYVILSAPAKGAGIDTVVHGVNLPAEDAQMQSCASCTTNSITPVVEIIGRRLGIQKALLTTIHAYTSTQAIVDAPSKKFRRGRAAAANFVPTTTGAAIATTLVLPQLVGKFDGVAVRAPIPVGSISDLVFLTEKETTVEEVNAILREEAESEKYQGIFKATDEQLVSSDIVGETHASIADLGMTRVVDGNLVKIMAWYDNETSFTSQMIREGVRIAQKFGF
ncbi:MAG: glyceraldehyde 3-phosphate dehydrogenase NAD-binding domain-containing protein [Chloroflexota bacterium]|nr:glyceraldehyde 3-phosphate dehydrogenase NAD-binding domain-containing protein [Chloroflexota bacterium]